LLDASDTVDSRLETLQTICLREWPEMV